MSALRISRPGLPVAFLDQGLAVGRISHTRGAVYGGVIVVAERLPGEPSEVRREQLAAAAARYRKGKR